MNFTDKVRVAYFSCGTKITSDPSGLSVLIENSKAGHPAVEIDLEIDRNAYGHSRGMAVPVSKGGERVRTRLSQPDGSAVLVKYDTRITSSFNGSVALVRRDRCDTDQRFKPNNF